MFPWMVPKARLCAVLFSRDVGLLLVVATCVDVLLT